MYCRSGCTRSGATEKKKKKAREGPILRRALGLLVVSTPGFRYGEGTYARILSLSAAARVLEKKGGKKKKRKGEGGGRQDLVGFHLVIRESKRRGGLRVASARVRTRMLRGKGRGRRGGEDGACHRSRSY